MKETVPKPALLCSENRIVLSTLAGYIATRKVLRPKSRNTKILIQQRIRMRHHHRTDRQVLSYPQSTAICHREGAGFRVAHQMNISPFSPMCSAIPIETEANTTRNLFGSPDRFFVFVKILPFLLIVKCRSRLSPVTNSVWTKSPNKVLHTNLISS